MVFDTVTCVLINSLYILIDEKPIALLLMFVGTLFLDRKLTVGV